MSKQSKIAAAIAISLTLMGAWHTASQCPGQAFAGFMGSVILFGIASFALIVLPVGLAYDAN